MIPNEVIDQLDSIVSKNYLVIGVGNEIRGDDAVGVYISETCKSFLPDKFINAGITIENYLFKIIEKYSENVILIIDAVHFDGKIGDISFIPVETLRDQGMNTHNLSLKKIAEIFRENKKEVYLLAIQPGNISIGSEMSEIVKTAADKIIEFFK